MIGFAKKKRASIAGGADSNRGGRSSALGGGFGLNLNNVGGDSRSALSSRSGLNSARGDHPPISLLPNPVQDKSAEDGAGQEEAESPGKVDYFRRIKTLNQANMSLKGNSALNSTLQNVNEMVEPSKEGAVFEIKNSAPEVGFKSVGYVPK